MLTIVDRLNGIKNEKYSDPSHVADCLRKVLSHWPRYDRIEHFIQSGLNYLLAGRLIDAQAEFRNARQEAQAIGNELEACLANVASNIGAAHKSLVRIYLPGYQV